MLLKTIFPLCSTEPMLNEVEALRQTSEYIINFMSCTKGNSTSIFKIITKLFLKITLSLTFKNV